MQPVGIDVGLLPNVLPPSFGFGEPVLVRAAGFEPAVLEDGVMESDAALRSRPSTSRGGLSSLTSQWATRSNGEDILWFANFEVEEREALKGRCWTIRKASAAVRMVRSSATL